MNRRLQNKPTSAVTGLQHTADHYNCPACIEANTLLLQIDSDFTRLPFNQAASLWMEVRRQRRNLKQRTHDTNAGYIEALGKFFGALRLCDITAGHLRNYQLQRTENPVTRIGPDGNAQHLWTHPAGHSIINHELCALSQILARAGLWAKLKPYYSALGIPKWSPRDVLTEEDEEHLFKVAAEHPEVQLAYWVACITNNTTAAGCELRGLRIKNLFLREGKEISEIYIPADAVKNNSRPRKIALNRTAKWAIEQCYRRAMSLGACMPDHYVFPLRLNREKTTDKSGHRDKYDMNRPASRWFLRKSWDKLREVTGLHQLNPHDLRHQCITRLLENGVQPETVRAIAGHVTEEMMQYYSHIRRQAKYDAVLTIEQNERGQGNKPGPRAVRRYA